MTIEILAKGLGDEDVQRDIQAGDVRVSIPSRDHEVKLRLWGAVVPEESETRVTPSKVEVKLKKASPGQWEALEAQEQRSGEADPRRFPSSKGKSKDWEKLAKEVEEEEEQELDSDGKLQKLFQDIYKNADEDTRRAMYKSYIESNGTTLSTNWDEVKRGKVETKPPEGMEAKSFNDTGKPA